MAVARINCAQPGLDPGLMNGIVTDTEARYGVPVADDGARTKAALGCAGP